MQLKRGFEAEYQRRHDAIWPQLKALLSESGVYDYTIFLEAESGRLFAFPRNRGEGTWGAIPLFRVAPLYG